MLQNQRSLPFFKLALAVGVPLILFTTSVMAIAFTSVGSNKIFTSNFEQDFSQWKKELCCSYSAQIVDSPTRAGKRAIKFTLKKNDPYTAGKPRAELKLGTVPANSERWYGFSIFLPKNFRKDSMGEIVTQWHARPDFKLGEDWPGGPPLYLLSSNGNWRLGRNWDSKQITQFRKPEGKETINLGAYKTGVWTDFVFHIKWSYKSDGLIEVWKNNKLILRRTGANTYNDRVGPYFKMGIYKPGWKNKRQKSDTSERIIYIDEVRIGDASANYQDVAPRRYKSSAVF